MEMRKERHLVQVTEVEMIIPLIDPLKKPSTRRLPIYTSIVGVLGLVGCFLLIYVFPSPVRTADGSLVPDTGQHMLDTLLMVLVILDILGSALLLLLQARRLRTPHHIRINQEGIFYSYYLFTFVKWDEIAAFVPHKGNNAGGPFVLSIVLRDETTVIARFLEANSKNIWQKTLYCFLTRASLWFSHTSNAPSPLSLHQSVLPLSIDELITAIQERFATELREYHITFGQGRS
jgi:hypothetical protein